MGFLTKAECDTLVDLLLDMPDADDEQWRNSLLRGLPRDLRGSIHSHRAARRHIENIVDIVNSDTWSRLRDGTCPLITVIDNALRPLRDTVIPDEWLTLQEKVRNYCEQASTVSSTTRLDDNTTTTTSSQPGTKLTGARHQQLLDALMDAFPSRAALVRLVRHRLNSNLNAITSDENLEDTAFQLINWAEAHGITTNLIDAAFQENPGNPALRAFIESWRTQRFSQISASLMSQAEALRDGSQGILTLFNSVITIWPRECDAARTSLWSLYEPIRTFQGILEDVSHLPQWVVPRRFPLIAALKTLSDQMSRTMNAITSFRDSGWQNPGHTTQRGNVQRELETLLQVCESISRDVSFLLQHVPPAA